MSTPPVTAIIIAQNEAAMIKQCLRCLQWCTHVLVVDNGSTDATAELAEAEGAAVISFKHTSFARVRNEALKHVRTDWLLYIDADERVTPDLAKELQVLMETSSASALTLQRKNFFFGSAFSHGGWERDQVTRCFKRADFGQWEGDIHESPVFTGSSLVCKLPLWHFSHRTVAEGLKKSAQWTPMEAELLFSAGEPPVTLLKVLKKGFSECIKRAVLKRGYKDGPAGVFEAVIQGINRMLVYIQVWELQQHPTANEKYESLEKTIAAKWQSE